MLNRSDLCVLVLGLLLSGTSPGAEICKWIDRDGRVHYSDVPLADRPCVERIVIQHADPLEQARAEERREALLRRQQESTQKAPKADEREARAASAAQRAERCASARDELRFLTEADGLRLLRAGRSGEEPMVWLDDRQRSELIDAWRRQVQGWCETDTQEPAAPPRAVAVPPPPQR